MAAAAGESALALIRCSGKGAIEKAAGVFSRPQKLLEAAGNTLVHGWIVDGEDNTNQKRRIDEVLVSVYRAPRSYTGEDGVDISCHGGSAVCAAVMAALKRSGFREALPGEFTFRAFMNGKLDLSRAESVMELVSAKSERGRSNAAARLSGVLENEINAIKGLVVEVLSETELFLDYPEDEAGETAALFPGREKLEEAAGRLTRLLSTWEWEKLCRQGALLVIAGRPNAGKSSVFNLLLKEERSIVTEIPGTTRDWIEAWLSIRGIPVRLVDTAGLREVEDPVEKIGVERSRDLLGRADLVLYVLDGGKGDIVDAEDFCSGRNTADNINTVVNINNVVALWNKADLASLPAAYRSRLTCPLIQFSAVTGEGLEELGRAIVEELEAKAGAKEGTTEGAGLGTERQKVLCETSLAELNEALSLAAREEALDIIAPCLREAVNALGEITGEVSTADLLEAMFSRFCVGK